jgi:hypothetical protein
MVEGEGKVEFVVRKTCDTEPDSTKLPDIEEIEGLVIGLTQFGMLSYVILCLILETLLTTHPTKPDDFAR